MIGERSLCGYSLTTEKAELTLMLHKIGHTDCMGNPLYTCGTSENGVSIMLTETTSSPFQEAPRMTRRMAVNPAAHSCSVG